MGGDGLRSIDGEIVSDDAHLPGLPSSVAAIVFRWVFPNAIAVVLIQECMSHLFPEAKLFWWGLLGGLLWFLALYNRKWITWLTGDSRVPWIFGAAATVFVVAGGSLEAYRTPSEFLPTVGGKYKRLFQWDLDADVGERLPFGRCRGQSCYVLENAGIAGVGRDAVVQFKVKFTPPDLPASNWFLLKMPLREGCTRHVFSRVDYELNMTVTDDTHHGAAVDLQWQKRPPPAKDAATDFTRSEQVWAIPSARIECGRDVFVCIKRPGDEAVSENAVACITPLTSDPSVLMESQ